MKEVRAKIKCKFCHRRFETVKILYEPDPYPYSLVESEIIYMNDDPWIFDLPTNGVQHTCIQGHFYPTDYEKIKAYEMEHRSFEKPLNLVLKEMHKHETYRRRKEKNRSDEL